MLWIWLYYSNTICQHCSSDANCAPIFAVLKLLVRSGLPRFPQPDLVRSNSSQSLRRVSRSVRSRSSWANEGLVMIRNYRVEPVARKIPSRKENFTRRASNGQKSISISTSWENVSNIPVFLIHYSNLCVQESEKWFVRGWENFITAPAYLFSLALPWSCLAMFCKPSFTTL